MVNKIEKVPALVVLLFEWRATNNNHETKQFQILMNAMKRITQDSMAVTGSAEGVRCYTEKVVRKDFSLQVAFQAT